MPDINIEKINTVNWAAVTKLSVSKVQKTVFPIENVYWLGISKYEEHTQLYAIGYESEYIGMAGLGKKDARTGIISPLMIDQNYQRRGFGTSTLHELIALLKREYQVKIVQVNVRKNNEQGREFFLKNGFEILDEDHKDYCLQYVLEA